MRRSIFLITLLLIANVFNSQSQYISNPTKFDTLPVIRNFRQNLDILDRIRCATYLFVRNFTVIDSSGNIYLSLYHDRAKDETVSEVIEESNRTIFNVTYTYALEPDIDYLKSYYHTFVLLTYDKNGELIHYNAYDIKGYKHHDTHDYMERLLERVRIPNTWTLKNHEYKIIYYCMDKAERPVFWKPLLNILFHLSLLRKDCTKWHEFYPGCNQTEFAESGTLKLN